MDGFLDLIDREASRPLARRILYKSFKERGGLHRCLSEQVRILGPPVVVLIGNNVCPLKRIHTQIKDLGYAQASKRILPDIKSTRFAHFAEDRFPIAKSQADQLGIIIEIVKLLTIALRLLAKQIRQLIVSVEMNLEGFPSEVRTL